MIEIKNNSSIRKLYALYNEKKWSKNIFSSCYIKRKRVIFPKIAFWYGVWQKMKLRNFYTLRQLFTIKGPINSNLIKFSIRNIMGVMIVINGRFAFWF